MAESTSTKTKIDWSVFNWPKILFTELRLANNTRQTTPADQLKCGRDMLVDWIVVSEGTYSSGGGAGLSYLPFVDVNWWIHDRSRWSVAPVAAAATVDTLTGVGRVTNPIAVETAGRGVFQLQHPIKWLYPALQSVSIEWLNPQSANPTGTLPLTVSMHGVGITSGARRVFTGGFSFLTNAAGVTQGILSNTQTLGNPGDQSYLMSDFILYPNGAAWNALGDGRITNHLRIRVRPTNGDAWSDVPVPIIFYGVHEGQPNRAAWHRPPGGPILLRRNQQFVFDVFNNASGVTTDVQIALIGRVAPSYKDIE